MAGFFSALIFTAFVTGAVTDRPWLMGASTLAAAVLLVLVTSTPEREQHQVNEPEPADEAVPEYMYVDFPDGTTRRCRTSVDPTYGFPVTPSLSSPAWEIVND